MQYGVLHPAQGTARGTVVLIHGGFWRGTPDYFDGPTPLAEALVQHGWHVWQIEYRQTPNGGGWPGTLDDVAAGVEHLAVAAASLGLDTGSVVTVGHSAGGHLAVWALSRPSGVLPLAGAVSLAGALNLRLGEQEHMGDGAVVGFLGGGSAEHPDRYAAADPVSRIEPGLPVRIVHGRQDDVVPMNQSDTYVAAAERLGQDVAIAVVEGDHMAVIHPAHPAFDRLLAALDEIVADRPARQQGSTVPPSRVLAPTVTAGTKGPASYFPSIERTYGRPIQEWLDLVVERLEGRRHMEVVDLLKTEHGLGHGHANALVAYVRQHQAD
jgi:acetyl esterase/lipase